MKPWFTIACLTAWSLCGFAQQRMTCAVAYYDVDRLYDTMPSLFYNDDDYTPQGLYRWNTERYMRKVGNTAAVVDSMALPVVALWGVENRAVVCDIVRACRGDYTFIHRTLNTFDGRDFALLYYGDRFFPDFVAEGRRYLYVEGEYDGERVGLLMVAEHRMARLVVEELREERSDVRLVVMGRCDGVQAERFGLEDVHRRAERAGRGTMYSRGRWVMRDRILVDTVFRSVAGDVYAREFLFDDTGGVPLRTIDRRGYRGGYGYSLPVYAGFEIAPRHEK